MWLKLPYPPTTLKVRVAAQKKILFSTDFAGWLIATQNLAKVTWVSCHTSPKELSAVQSFTIDYSSVVFNRVYAFMGGTAAVFKGLNPPYCGTQGDE